MPALTSRKILITGANSYIAFWIIKDLLEHGYAVRGTVRFESKAGCIREYFKEFGDRLEIVIVEDVTADGAFDAHMADVDAVAHTASPVQPPNGEPSEVIQPAVRGTRSVLASVLLHRGRIRRVLVLSSAVALSLEIQEGKTVTLDESSWNKYSVAHCEEKGRDAEPMHKYCASKVLAERAAWDFYASAKAELKGEALGWDLAVFCPPFVFGPIIHGVPSLEAFGRTPADWYKRVVKGEMSGPAARQPTNLRCFPVIAARRYSDKISPGDESYKAEDACYPHIYIAKSIGVLGIEYRSLDELTRDTLEDFVARGWL